MARISSAILSLRRDARIQKLPPYLSLFCIAVGVIWLLLLPLDSYSRYTYISENALLPGQVHTYFAGSEQNIFRAYRHEVQGLADMGADDVADKLGTMLKAIGLKVAYQRYGYVSSAGQTTTKTQGKNVYAILHAPRGDATEAIVLIAAWRNAQGELNESGVALLLTLARYFKRWSLWSKDIIFLIPTDSWAGPQAWADAYHDAHDPRSVESLPLKSGALQGVVAVDHALSHRFDSIHIVYDGINGQLPNLDLVNTASAIAGGQMGMGVCMQRMWKHDDGYRDRLRTMLRGMFSQGMGQASGPHSSFIPYHVDAITLQAVGDGWQDEMALGRTVESIFRSLNNLLEHFHQSFFFYLLMRPNRFVSIGTYLPSAMLIAGNFTIMAIALWIQSGRPENDGEQKTSTTSKEEDPNEEKEDAASAQLVEKDGMIAVILPQATAISERKMFLPLTIVIGIHFLGIVPLYIFNHSTPNTLLSSPLPTFLLLLTTTTLAPHLLSHLLRTHLSPTPQQILLIQSFSLLLLGLFLSALATLNFSLSFLIGLLSSPLSFIRPASSSSAAKKKENNLLKSLLLHLLSPMSLLSLYAFALGGGGPAGLNHVLTTAGFAWNVHAVWTPVVVWYVWWPAWFVGVILLGLEAGDRRVVKA
ncbi:MAG: Glycosyl phosphatidyl inositol protein transamidase complex subunit [Peltula sp. TS41687]|nr:MAG: Glycosyl phosphatidyl inositol protein transamidase complex subunit [Peltula sp. TS41687]